MRIENFIYSMEFDMVTKRKQRDVLIFIIDGSVKFFLIVRKLLVVMPLSG